MATGEMADVTERAMTTAEELGAGDARRDAATPRPDGPAPRPERAEAAATAAAASHAQERRDPPAPPFPDVLRARPVAENLSVPSLADADRPRAERTVRVLACAVYVLAAIALVALLRAPVVSLVAGIACLVADAALRKRDVRGAHVGAARASGAAALAALLGALYALVP